MASKNGNGARAEAATAKVIVACKIPLGVLLHVDTEEKRVVETPSGAKEVKEYRRGEPVQIMGPAYPNGQAPEGFRDRPPIEGGYALTSGVDEEFWDAWWAQNADERCTPDKMHHVHGCKCVAMIRNRMIFAYHSREDARSAAREGRDLQSGLEPLRVDGDYRSPRPLMGIQQVKPERVAPRE